MLQLLAALIAIAKAIPAVRDLIFAARDAIETAEREAARDEDHATIDADRARLGSGPWVCPRLCPLARHSPGGHGGSPDRLHDAPHAEPGQPPAGPA